MKPGLGGAYKERVTGQLIGDCDLLIQNQLFGQQSQDVYLLLSTWLMSAEPVLR